MLLSSAEILYTILFSPTNLSGGSQKALYVLITLGFAVLYGVIFAALFSILIKVAERILKFLPLDTMNGCFALAVFWFVVIDVTLTVLFYWFVELRVMKVYIAVNFMIFMISLILVYPVMYNLGLIFRGAPTNSGISRPEFVGGIIAAIVMSPFMPLIALMRKKGAPLTLRIPAILVLFGTCVFLFWFNIFEFHTYGRYIHIVITVIMFILSEALFYIIWLAVAQKSVLLQSALFITKKAFIIAAFPAIAMIVAAFTLLNDSANVKFVAFDRTEILRTELMAMNGVLDFDNDGYSVFCGDVDDWDSSKNPLKGYFNDFSHSPSADANLRVREKLYGKLPNVIVISIDALRADVIGCYGAAIGITSNIDKFAEESTVYEKAYCPGPATPIAMHSIINGRYSSRLLNAEIDEANPVKLLHELGFKHIILPSASIIGGINLPDEPGREIMRIIADKGNNSSDSVSRQTIDYLTSVPAGAAVFCWTHYLDPHFEFKEHPEVKVFGSTMREKYYNEVLYTDKYVGQLLDFLREKGYFENSIIVLTADHGTELFDHSRYYHGFNLYEESIRVPFIVHFPTGMKETPERDIPKRITAPVSIVSMYPTLLSWLGGRADFSDVVQMPLREPDSGDVYVVSAYGDKFCIISGNRKLIYNRSFDVYEMYALEGDPGERTNIYDLEGQSSAILQKLFEFVYRHREIYKARDPMAFKGE